MKDKIDEQVEQAPLTKEESKAQFYQITEMLGLKHSFNFDEAWEIGEEIRRRKDFRENISILEDAVVNAEGGMTGQELHEANPVKHTFAGGCYIREIYNPADELIITKIHKKEHPFFFNERRNVYTYRGRHTEHKSSLSRSYKTRYKKSHIHA